MSNKNIFIIESSFGVHHAVDSKFNADIMSFTFLPNLHLAPSEHKIDLLEDFFFLMPSSINPLRLNSQTTKIENIASFIKDNKYNHIFIGTDLDVTGNAMARIIYDYLLANGLEKDNITRIPLTSKGFLFVSEFWSNISMRWWLRSSLEEVEYVQYSKKALGSHGVGRRAPLILNEILSAPKEIINITPNSTSSITYLFKKSIKEK